MEHQTTVKLFVEEDPTQWISCAIVYLYDRDRLSRDDHLGMDITNSFGEAVFRFSDEEFVDLDDRVGGSLPELYVKLFDAAGECVLSTRASAVPNRVPALIRVAVPRDVALRHGLI